MAFELKYDKLEDVPTEVLYLYVEDDSGAYVLLKSSSIKTTKDVDVVRESLRKEREDHKSTKQNLAKFGTLNAEETLVRLDRIDELEALNDGKATDEKISELVEKRLLGKTAPLQREIDNLKATAIESSATITNYETKDTQRTIHDHIRKASAKSKIRESAVQDVMVIGEQLFEVEDGTNNIVTKDNVGVTPGLNVDDWLTECQETRQHWWPDSQGGGATGGAGTGMIVNPFSHKDWSMSKQAELYKSDSAKAAKMAEIAGTTVGGQRPAAA